jgi:hypothetical protein
MKRQKALDTLYYRDKRSFQEIPIDVPLIENKPLGPIHSLIRDHQGNIYLSDEINNRVLCLTEQGELVWWRGANSIDWIQFRYPRGLAFGRIRIENSAFAECLAVCDSWNNRVVFLSPEGVQIGEWKTAGDRSLREVSDIRYIDNPEWTEGMADSQRNHWLLLDRSNHRLCWLGLNGQLLAQAGRPFSPWLERFLKPPDFASLAAKCASPELRPDSPFDFLYYPSRLVGGSDQILAVSEPLNRSLKLIYRNLLFSLPLDRTRYAWLAFNDSGFLGWNDSDRVLVFLDLNGREVVSIATDGLPIYADLSEGEWWEQKGQSLIRHAFVHPLLSKSSQNERNQTAVELLQQLAALDVASIDLVETEAALSSYLGSIDNLLTLADQLVAIMREQGAMGALPQSLPKFLDEMLANLQLKSDTVRSRLQVLYAAALKWSICRPACSEASLHPNFRRFLPFICRMRASLNAKFIELTASLDRIVLAGFDFVANTKPQNANLIYLSEIRSKIDAALWPIGKVLSDCSEIVVPLDSTIRERTCDRSTPSMAGSRKTYGLKEIHCWPIEANAGLHRYPRHFALSKSGAINISFGTSNSILEISPNGKPLGQWIAPSIPGNETAGPNGIAWDDDGRLWLTYGSSKCVVIWDVSKNSFQIVSGADDVNGFNVPFGICKGAPGHMLITDSADHRLIDISYQGHCRCLTGGRGRMPGQFINPYSLIGVPVPQSEQPCAIWVVDHRNHRLQKLSLSGDYLSELGGCGLEKGNFSLPLTATAFPDGTLAVSMWHFIRCLMLVSPQGEELGRTSIDFIPDGMLALENNLLVADYEGNQIRVYERPKLN